MQHAGRAHAQRAGAPARVHAGVCYVCSSGCQRMPTHAMRMREVVHAGVCSSGCQRLLFFFLCDHRNMQRVLSTGQERVCSLFVFFVSKIKNTHAPEFCRPARRFGACVFFIVILFQMLLQVERTKLMASQFFFFWRMFSLIFFPVRYYLQVERTKLMASQDALKTDADAMRMEVQHFMKEGRLQVNPKFTSLTSIKVQLMTLTRLAYRHYTKKKNLPLTSTAVQILTLTRLQSCIQFTCFT